MGSRRDNLTSLLVLTCVASAKRGGKEGGRANSEKQGNCGEVGKECH